MTGKLKDLHFTRSGEQVLSITVKADVSEMFDELKDFDVDIEIKKHREKRSKDANAYCWVLCEKIANAVRSTKEDVYREEIKQVGVYTPLPIKEDAVEKFDAIWRGKGLGWFTEVIDDSKLPGYKLVFAYYGSSTYDTTAMSRLIDWLVDNAKQMDLPIPASKEQEEMLKAWASR